VIFYGLGVEALDPTAQETFGKRTRAGWFEVVIEVTHVGNVAMFRMAHGKANALDIELCNAIAQVFAEDQSSSSRALVLTGRGRIFSAGVDLVRLLDGGKSYIHEFLPALSRAIEAVFVHPKPVIMAINGHAIAGGCVLACAGDKRLMAREPGRIGVTELLVGVPFPALALEVMRVLTAPQCFHEMIYSGATYPANVAAVLGIIDEVTEPDALIARAIEAANTLAALRPDAFALTKRQSRAPVLEYLQRVGPGLDAAVEELWAAPDTPVRISTYVSRTFGKTRSVAPQD
jgi:enoyl-CoA hydratase